MVLPRRALGAGPANPGPGGQLDRGFRGDPILRGYPWLTTEFCGTSQMLLFRETQGMPAQSGLVRSETRETSSGARLAETSSGEVVKREQGEVQPEVESRDVWSTLSHSGISRLHSRIQAGVLPTGSDTKAHWTECTQKHNETFRSRNKHKAQCHMFVQDCNPDVVW